MREKSKSLGDHRKIIRYTPSVNVGLLPNEVELRKSMGFSNKSKTKSSKSYGEIIFKNIFTFFNMLMVAIAAALIFFCGISVILNLAFLLLLIVNTSIGTIQECKSKRTIDKLQLLNAARYTVTREGMRSDILSEEIVIDDILELSVGDQVPVDCQIINDEQIEVNESLLTGESLPVKKGLGDTLLAGSYILSGLAMVYVDKVGDDTYLSSIEKQAKSLTKPKSKLMTAINKIIKTLAAVAIPLALIVFWNELINSSIELPLFDTWGNKNRFSDAILYAGTTITYMIPAGMLLLSSVAMATGVVKLAKRKTLANDLYSVESLARVDTLCLDKTGTLTDGTMTVEKVIEFVPDVVYSAMPAYLGTFRAENITSKALVKHFGILGDYPAMKKVEFSSARKFSAAQLDDDNCSFALGAPDYLVNDEKILETVRQYSSEGFRVLAFVRFKENLIDRDEDVDGFPEDKEIIALIIVRDNIRAGVVETMKWFRENNVDIRVISGDNPDTVSFIAGKAGIQGYTHVLDMSKVSKDDPDFEELVMKTVVFGRVSPEQKTQIVEILQKNNRTVAMTGDGINDLTALKKADCSIALANGAPATKNIANLVLMDSNFNHMQEAVFEGRRVINNIQRSSTLFMMKDFLWMFITILPFLFGMQHILEPTVMTLVNIFITGLGSIFLALEPNSERVSGGFYKRVLEKAIISGAFIFIPVLIVFFYSIISCGLDVGGGAQKVEELIPVITACITVSGIIVFFDICYPFTKFRFIVFMSILVFVVLVLFALPKAFMLNGTSYVKELMEGRNLWEVIKYLFSHELFNMEFWQKWDTEKILLTVIYTGLSIPIYFVIRVFGKPLVNDIVFKPRDFSDDEK